MKSIDLIRISQFEYINLPLLGDTNEYIANWSHPACWSHSLRRCYRFSSLFGSYRLTQSSTPLNSRRILSCHASSMNLVIRTATSFSTPIAPTNHSAIAASKGLRTSKRVNASHGYSHFFWQLQFGCLFQNPLINRLVTSHSNSSFANQLVGKHLPALAGFFM